MNPQCGFLRSFLYLAVSTCAAQVVDINYTTQSNPDFYLNDQITFTCTASGFTDIGILELIYDGGSVYKSGCVKNFVRGWGSRGPPLINEVTGIESPSITQDDCKAIAKPEGFTLEVKVTITDISVSGKFYCKGVQPDDAVPSSEVTIPSIKELPNNLILTIHPNNTSVFEGEEFTFTCTSDDSLAEFDYKLNDKTVTTQSYTPTVSDRGGITIKCTDKGHSRIQGGSIERVLMPVFREGNAGNMDCITKPLVVFNLILALCLVI